MGADGAIGSTYNFIAEKFINIKSLYESNKHQEAKALQVEANEIIQALTKVGVFQGIKFILSEMAISCGGCRRPFSTIERG